MEETSSSLLVPWALGLLCAAAAISLIFPQTDSATTGSSMTPSVGPFKSSSPSRADVPLELPSSTIAKQAAPLPEPAPTAVATNESRLQVTDVNLPLAPEPVVAETPVQEFSALPVPQAIIADLADTSSPPDHDRPQPDLKALRNLLAVEASLADDRLAAKTVGYSLPPASANAPTPAEFSPLLSDLIERIGADPENPQIRDELATVFTSIGAVAQSRQDISTPLGHYKSALLTGAMPPAGMAVRLGLILDQQGDDSASECAFEFGGRVLHQLDGPTQVSASWVLPVPAYLARAFLNSSKPDAALEIYRHQGNPATVGRSIALWMKGDEQGAMSVFSDSGSSTVWGNANVDWMGAPAVAFRQLQAAAKTTQTL